MYIATIEENPKPYGRGVTFCLHCGKAFKPSIDQREGKEKLIAYLRAYYKQITFEDIPQVADNIMALLKGKV